MEFWIFILIFIPLGILIGIAAAMISYTAWSIAVPFVFVVLGFDVYDALFLSVLIDFVDGAILTVIHKKRGNINFKDGLIWAIPTTVGAIIAFGFSSTFIQNNSDMFRGGVGYVIIIMGMGFAIKGYNGIKESKKNKIEGQEGMPPEPKGSIKDKFNPTMVKVLALLSFFLFGALGGLIGIGSGMNFVLVFLLFFPGYSLKKASATGAFMMFLMTLAIGILYAPLVHFDILWPYLIVTVAFSSFGTILAAKFAKNLSPEALNFTVGIIVVLAGVVASVQGLFF